MVGIFGGPIGPLGRIFLDSAVVLDIPSPSKRSGRRFSDLHVNLASLFIPLKKAMREPFNLHNPMY